MTFFARQIRNLLPVRTAVLGLVGLKECADQRFDPKVRIKHEIDEVLERFRMTRRLPGMEVMILKDGQEFYRQEFGVKDRENNNVLYARGTTVPYGPICGCYASLLCLAWLQSSEALWTDKMDAVLQGTDEVFVNNTKMIQVLLERWGSPGPDRNYETPPAPTGPMARVFKTDYIVNMFSSTYKPNQTTNSCAYCFEILAHWVNERMIEFKTGLNNFLGNAGLAGNVRFYSPSVRHKDASLLYISQKDSSENFVYTNRFYEDWSQFYGMHGLEGNVEGLANLGAFFLDCLKPTSDKQIRYENIKDMLEKYAYYENTGGVFYEGRSMGWKITARKGSRNLWNVNYTADGTFAYLHLSRTKVPSFDFTGINSLDSFNLKIKHPHENLGQGKVENLGQPSPPSESVQDNSECDRNNVVIAMTSNLKIKLADALMDELCALVRSVDEPDDD